MKYIKSIFAVSIVAMAVVGNARASIVSQTNIVGGSNVSVEVPPSGTNAGKVVISATDTNTTYTTGTTTYSGTTKLYTGTGSATDGTLTQKAITDALGDKENAANKVVSGGDMEKALKEADADTKYPTLKAALEVAQIAAGAATATYGELANHNIVSTDLIANDAVTTEKIAANAVTTAKIKDANVTMAKVADGAITTAKIANGTILEEDLSKAVKDKLNAAVQTVEPTSATTTTGKYVTNLTKDGTTVKVETAYVKIPVGSATAPTGVASIWVE